MTNIRKTLLNVRSLNAFCRDNLSLEEVEKVTENLQQVITNLKEQEAERLAEEQKKQDQLDRIKAELAKSGLSVSDLLDAEPKKKKVAPAKPKYEYFVDGVRFEWSGRGKKPTELQKQLNSGKSLDSFLIK